MYVYQHVFVCTDRYTHVNTYMHTFWLTDTCRGRSL